MDKSIYSYILSWVELNLYTGASVSSLIKVVGYSRSKLETVFSLHSGMPLGRYIFRRRITRAAVTLRMTILPVMEIAMQLHYHSGQNFSRAFRSCFGRSPSAYRNESVWDRSTLQMPLHYPQPECQGDVVDIDQVRFIFGERFKFKVGFGFNETADCQLINKIKEYIRRRCETGIDSVWIAIAINGAYCVSSGRKGLVSTEFVAGDMTENKIRNGVNGVSVQAGKYIMYCFKGSWEEYLVFLRMILTKPLAGYNWSWISNEIFMKVDSTDGDSHRQQYQIYIPVIRGTPNLDEMINY